MQCKCLEEVIKNVLEMVQKPGAAGPTAKVECAGSAITFGETLDQRVYVPFRVTADKTGYRSAKGKEIPVFATYCPWCGQLAVKPEEEKEPA